MIFSVGIWQVAFRTVIQGPSVFPLVDLPIPDFWNPLLHCQHTADRWRRDGKPGKSVHRAVLDELINFCLYCVSHP